MNDIYKTPETNDLASPNDDFIANGETYTLPGVNVALMGPAGTGKTHAIGTLVDAGIEVFYIDLESGLESLVGYWKDRGLPIPENLHWHRLTPPKAGLANLMDIAQKVGSMSYESLTKFQDPNRMKENRFLDFLNVLADFKDQRTGKSYGNSSAWGTDRALVIDGLSGISDLAMQMVTGNKPCRSPSDYGVAQNNIKSIIRELANSWSCHFILLSHITRETDQLLGGTKIFMKSQGVALNSELPQIFSDVILAVRNGKTWSWSTANPMADTKTRNLAVSDNLPPDFGVIISKWRSRSQIADAPVTRIAA